MTSAAAPAGRLGILGGTFNPPHLGHLACARHAYRELGLGRVLLMPAHIPPHKQVDGDPGVEHRQEMCRLAVEGDYRLLASSIEARRAGPSYTVDTLRELHTSNPGVELTFIVGADVARTLPEWREPQAILELAQIAVAEREGSPRAEVAAVIAAIRPDARVRYLAMPAFDVSSSLVRQRAREGRPIDDLVPGRVAEYIRRHHLYSAPVPTGSAG
jgi:nicotinate-nucleotide adenylyltransferase